MPGSVNILNLFKGICTMTILKTDFAQKTAALTALSRQAYVAYGDEVRASWLTVTAIHNVLVYLAKAASCLAEFQTRKKRLSDASEMLAFQLADGIVAIETAVASYDIERVKSNALYATKLCPRVQQAQRSAEALMALADGLYRVVLAEDNCALIKQEVEALKASPRLRTYAIAQETFVNCNGTPAQFFKGQPYLVEISCKDGSMQLAYGMEFVFLPADVIKKSFQIVKL